MPECVVATANDDIEPTAAPGGDARRSEQPATERFPAAPGAAVPAVQQGTRRTGSEDVDPVRCPGHRGRATAKSSAEGLPVTPAVVVPTMPQGPVRATNE